MWLFIAIYTILLWNIACTLGTQLPNAHIVAPVNTCSGDVIDVMVVGSGLSGGTAAYYLNKKGVRVMLTDAREEAGGNLITKQGQSIEIV